MNKYIFTIAMMLFSGLAMGQNLKLSFMSESGARFFVYLNGKLQNENSVGHITIDNLENKEYHVRIEIDDPYQMVCTQSLRPSETKYEYSVNFNAVRERIYIKPVKEAKQERDEYTSSTFSRQQTPRTEKPERQKKNRNKTNPPEPNGTTGTVINRIKTNMIEE